VRAAVAAVIVVAIVTSVTGCGLHEYTIQVKDPRAVTLLDTPTPATAADGAPILASGTHYGKPWSLHVLRDPDGALRLRCALCNKNANKDAFLVGVDGSMHMGGEASPEALGLMRPSAADVEHGARVVVPYRYCGFSRRRGGCEDAAWSGARVTAWANVTEVRDRRGTAAAGSPVALVAAVVLGGFGAFLVGAGVTSDKPTNQIAAPILGATLLLLSAGLVTLFVDGYPDRVLDSPATRASEKRAR